MALPNKAAPAPKNAKSKTVEFSVNTTLVNSIIRLIENLERNERAVLEQQLAESKILHYSGGNGAIGAAQPYDGTVANHASPSHQTVPLEIMIEDASGRLSKILEGSSFIKNRLIGENQVNGCEAANAPFQSHGFSKDRLLAMFTMMDQIELNLGAIQSYILS